MIRSRRLTPSLLNAWLVQQAITPTNPQYRLRLWRENRPALLAIKRELIEYVEEGFDDARRRIRSGFEDTLSPFSGPAEDPAANYPAILHRVTLQGYFGEALAVLAVEHWGAHGHQDWVVPAFLFRFHDVEFEHLDSINIRIAAGEVYNQDEEVEQRPGRTGDDALAFRKMDSNVITDVLVLEAKCLKNNSEQKIAEAHKKVSSGGRRPSGVRELIKGTSKNSL